MTSIHYKDSGTLQTLVSDEFSAWSSVIRIDQGMINQYAALSGDYMWLHVDEERCARESPYGCTIAHGFLTLSLLPRMLSGPNLLDIVTGYGYMMNYGSDKLRFLEPVPVNSEIHCRNRIKEIEVGEKKTRVVTEVHVHIVGNNNPAMIYEMMFVFL